MIVNLRGTNGSGKSTVARDLIDLDQDAMRVTLVMYRTKAGREAGVFGYRLPNLRVVVVGKYETACGGCDGIKTQDLICDAVRAAADLEPNVLFEGVIVSTLYSRYAELAKEFPRRFAFAYLDTPLKTCLKRIQRRNGGKPIKEDLVAAKIRAIESTRQKAIADGFPVFEIAHRAPADEVLGLLRMPSLKGKR